MHRYKHPHDTPREWMIDRERAGKVAVMARSWDPPTEGQWVTVCRAETPDEAEWLVKRWERNLAALRVIGAHADETV